MKPGDTGPRFEFTAEDYIKAKEYLSSINKLAEFNSNKTSIDGYSLVAYANSLRKEGWEPTQKKTKG